MKQTKTLRIFIASLLVSCILFSCDNPSVNIKPADNQYGNANMTINGLGAFAGGNQNQYITVNFSGTLQDKANGNGEPTFNVSQKFEITPSGNISPGTTVQQLTLQPGTWKVTAQLNSWSASCTAKIEKGGGTAFVFTYNNPGCTN